MIIELDGQRISIYNPALEIKLVNSKVDRDKYNYRDNYNSLLSLEIFKLKVTNTSVEELEVSLEDVLKSRGFLIDVYRKLVNIKEKEYKDLLELQMGNLVKAVRSDTELFWKEFHFLIKLINNNVGKNTIVEGSDSYNKLSKLIDYYLLNTRKVLDYAGLKPLEIFKSDEKSLNTLELMVKDIVLAKVDNKDFRRKCTCYVELINKHFDKITVNRMLNKFYGIDLQLKGTYDVKEELIEIIYNNLLFNEIDEINWNCYPLCEIKTYVRNIMQVVNNNTILTSYVEELHKKCLDLVNKKQSFSEVQILINGYMELFRKYDVDIIEAEKIQHGLTKKYKELMCYEESYK